MNTRRKLKRESRRMLKGMWLKGIVLFVVSFFISAVCTMAEETVGYFLQLDYFDDPVHTPENYLDNTPSLSPAILLLFLGGMLLPFFLSAPLRIGNKGWYLHLVAKDPKPLSYAFEGYYKPMKYLKSVVFETRLFFRRSTFILLSFLPAILLYSALPFLEQIGIPELLFSLLSTLMLGMLCLLASALSLLWIGRSFLAEYLYSFYPCRMRDAFQLSAIIMKGRKTALFSLILSFAPLYLADLLVLPRLWTVPRRNAAFARYARHFMESYEQEKEEQKRTHKQAEGTQYATKEFPCIS